MIQSVYTPERYSGDDVLDTFSFGWIIVAKSTLIAVTKIVATGVETILELDSDYTIDDDDVNNDDGGDVVLTDPLPTGTDLYLRRSTPLTQLLNIETGKAFPAAGVMSALDKLTLIMQERTAADQVGGEVVVDAGEFEVDIEFDEEMDNAGYDVIVMSPNWNTKASWNSKATTGFSVLFDTPAPSGNGRLVWRVIR